MRTLRVVLIVSIVALGFGRQTSAQGLTYSVFERYLETLRQQSAIPGMSAAIVQNGAIIWEKAFGLADVENNVAPTSYTPYVLGNASEVFASTLLLRRCVDHSYLQPTDRVVRWVPSFGDPVSTVGHLLAQATAAGTYQYDAARYAALTGVIEQCTTTAYKKVLATDIFDQFHMLTGSVPGQSLAAPTREDRLLFDATTLSRYAATISQLAVPYRVDSNGHATRSGFLGQPLDAAGGAISNVDDLAHFVHMLEDGALTPAVDQLTTTQASFTGVPLPTGFGWFVQPYNKEVLVWQFGMVKDAYSSLILRLKNHNVTLILLANSDGLSSPFALENGDVTASPFAKIFLRIFGI